LTGGESCHKLASCTIRAARILKTGVANGLSLGDLYSRSGRPGLFIFFIYTSAPLCLPFCLNFFFICLVAVFMSRCDFFGFHTHRGGSREQTDSRAGKHSKASTIQKRRAGQRKQASASLNYILVVTSNSTTAKQSWSFHLFDELLIANKSK
jgi:hypothetical protein